MSDSFLFRPGSFDAGEARRRRVVVTGAAGRIGSYFARHNANRYDLLLLVQSDDQIGEVEQFGQAAVADLLDLERLKGCFHGADTVLHLAALPSPSETWRPLLANNIEGTYNAMVAAHAAGCRRLVYASSIHAVSGYSPDRQVQADDPVSPGDLYGVTKCFGEAMGRFMATQHGLSVLCIRIGAFQPLSKAQNPSDVSMMNAFVSHRDLNALIGCCIDDERLLFGIFHGLSNNRFNRMNIEEAKELVGYDPQPCAEGPGPAWQRASSQRQPRVCQWNPRGRSRRTAQKAPAKMNGTRGKLRVGTSGWQYNHWRGLFYPEDLRQANWFGFYSEHFDTVEVNNTFYHLPPIETFQKWADQAPAGFLYVLKFSRYGSHLKRLLNPDQTVKNFLENAQPLGLSLGPILVQLPPRWNADVPRLAAFLDAAPRSQRWALEFRDASWLCDRVFQTLRDHNAALVIHDNLPDHPRIITADWLYLRFHGNNPAQTYNRQDLLEWADFARSRLAEGLDVYAYFNNDLAGHAIEDAKTLRQLLRD